MDFSDRGNRPLQQAGQSNQQPTNNNASKEFSMGRSSMGGSMKSKSGGVDMNRLASVFVLFAVSILVLVLIFGLIFGTNGDDDASSSNLLTSEAALIKTEQYQAIFLNSQDGQVYFGKLSIVNDHLYKLEDIYYVRVENPIQPEGVNQPAQPNISLAKLGNELHGPEDTMYIARDKLLYWENLKSDGQVVDAITRFKADGGQSTQNTNTNNDAAAGATQPTGTESNGTDTGAGAPPATP